jgi:hypothetical protein
MLFKLGDLGEELRRIKASLLGGLVELIFVLVRLRPDLVLSCFILACRCFFAFA